MTNSAAIGSQLQDAKAGKPGALELPDLFSAHSSDAGALGIESLVDWNDWFTAEEMAAYVPGFVQDGILEGRQVVFPVSKSTQLIFLNGSQYAWFAADTGAQLSTLATWDGFFEMATAYRQWSQGKPFCALDYPLRLVELNALEEAMLEPLCRCLRQTSCSGAFVLLDATVNTRMEGAEHSRAGLYVQKSGADTPTVPLLLYRGNAEVGKTHSVMPHRKWRMEFQTDQFPGYDRWMTPGDAPLYQCYALTERFSIPGTSEEVQLLLLPLRGQDGTVYGLCGFEISESYFKQSFAQSTGFERLTCLLAPAGSELNAGAAFCSGTTEGYYHAPRETLVLRGMGGGLTQLIGADSAYAGITALCSLNENQSYRLAVCIPMADYQRLVFSGNLQMLLIGLFILFFVVFCCIYFHRHILSPAFRQLEEDRRESRRQMDELQLERQQMQTELSRLADVCRNESVPDAYQTFVAGIPSLTKTERRIFDGYAAGLRTREIVQQLNIKDSTLRFHNKNIYEKLGISSLKQLQQFITILNSGNNSAPEAAPDKSGRTAAEPAALAQTGLPAKKAP